MAGKRGLRAHPPRVAVIDIGSNSGRVSIFDLDPAGHLRIFASTRAALRLVGDVEQRHSLTPAAMERTLEALQDFRAMTLGAGAKQIVAVATAAVRDADNGQVLIDRIRRELGLRVRVMSGRQEARCGFRGALHGLEVNDGLFFDLGGGSLQVTRFRRRIPGRCWSLPLGALRLSAAFIKSDPPRSAELRRVRTHLSRLLREARLPNLRPGERLVGTGGTLRNLAKIDLRSRPYPVSRLHGYLLSAERVREISWVLAANRLRRREAIAGLSEDRADSIVGGALAVVGLLEAVGAEQVLVSGQGVREGLAYGLLGAGVPAPRRVREAALLSLAGRFRDWQPERAERRRRVAAALQRALEPKARPELREALDDAARLLDIGRAVDFFDRHAHVADMVMATELNGFSHREIALLAALLRRAGDPRSEPRDLAPLVTGADRDRIERAAVLLLLADDLEERCSKRRPVAVRCWVGKRQVTLDVRSLAGWRPRGVGPRFERAFGKALVVRPGAAR